MNDCRVDDLLRWGMGMGDCRVGDFFGERWLWVWLDDAVWLV